MDLRDDLTPPGSPPLDQPPSGDPPPGSPRYPTPTLLSWRMPLLAFAAIAAAFALLYLFDPALYRRMLSEDQPVEIATALLLVCGAYLSLTSGISLLRRDRLVHWFLWLLTLAAVFSALEEISFGQRLVGFDAPSYFREHNAQQEVNVHNTVQKSMIDAGFTMHMIHALVGVAILATGIGLPLLCLVPAIDRLRRSLRIIVPPLRLAPGFILAALLTPEWPTGKEMELAECCCGLCYAWWMWDVRRQIRWGTPRL